MSQAGRKTRVDQVHGAAARGFTDGAVAYQRGRPDYPMELLPWLTGALSLQAGKIAVDLGAGTGKFTKLLIATGAAVIAVEPVDAMREQLAAVLPDVSSIPGVAQALPLAGESVDVVVCAQAFHWFATMAALREIHRVLRPGGMLGLVWNVRDESVDWVAAMNQCIQPHEGDAPRFHTGEWRAAFDGSLFDDLAETRVRHRHVGPPREVVLDRVMSVSFIAALAAEERARVSAAVESLIATHPGLAGFGTVEMPYITRAFHCARR